jgi:ketosteroid isomerase-like protein
MDAQATMRLMFDTMDAYDRGDFARLAEIYAEDAHWINADPKGPHCRNRDDIFTMFRQRMRFGIRITFDELRSTPTYVVLTARSDDFGSVVSVFRFEGRRIVAVQDYSSMAAAESALWPVRRRWLGRFARFIRDLPRRLAGQRQRAHQPSLG